MNLANRITVARIILMPIVVALLLMPFPLFTLPTPGRALTGGQLLSTGIFVIATASDGLDGYIARKRNMITNFGKFLDPLADKLLIGSVLIALISLGEVPAWVAIVVISREFAVTGLRLVAADAGVVIAAGALGKWKTRLQVVGVTAVMLGNYPFVYIGVPVATILLYAAVVMTVVSGADYFVKNWSIIDAAH